jgi:hypothetical protein
MESRLSEEERKQKKKLIKEMGNHKQTMWIGIIIAILFFWTGIGLIGGLVMALVGYELKNKKEQKLVDFE